MKITKRFLSIILCIVMIVSPMLTSVGDVAYAKEKNDGNQIVGSLKIVARYNDDMAFYDGHVYLVFTSYQDGVTFPCTSETNYAAYSVSDSYYEDIAEDLGNGSWRTGTDTDQYFTFMDQSSLPGTMVLNRGQVITIGNYRDFDMSVPDAALGAVTNSTAWSSLSDDAKVAIVNLILNAVGSTTSVSETSLLQGAASALGSTGATGVESLFDGVVAGGICYNRELYNQKLEWDQFENVTFETEITADQLENLQSQLSQYNKFSLLENSCATVAVALWNAAVGDEYPLSANGTGTFAFIQEPKYVRDSIVANIPGYMTNKLESVEEEDAAATTDDTIYYVTAPSKVETDYVFDDSNVLSIYTDENSLDSLRFAGMSGETPSYAYSAGAVTLDVAIDTDVTSADDKTTYNIKSVNFSYEDSAVSSLSSYDQPVWFIAPVDKESVVRDENGNKLTSYYDAATQTVTFKVKSLPATVVIGEKADLESSNLTVNSDGDQEIYYYNGDDKIDVTDDTSVEEGTIVYVKPIELYDGVVETIKLSDTNGNTLDLLDSYSDTEDAYFFSMPVDNAELNIHYESVMVYDNDLTSIIQIKKGETVDLNDYFTVETDSEVAAAMPLKFEIASEDEGCISLSEDGTMTALAEGTTGIKAYLNDNIFTMAAIEVYDGDMISVTYEEAANGMFVVTSGDGDDIKSVSYSGYLVKSGSTISIETSPDEGYLVSEAYYNDGEQKDITMSGTTGSFTADADVTITVSFASAELTNVPDSISLVAGGTYALQPVLTVYGIAGGSFGPDIDFVSSDESIVTVDDYGMITAVSDGIAAVTVSAAAGEGIEKTCTVNVGNVDGSEVVGRLTITARPTSQSGPRSFVTFTSYKDTDIDVNYNQLYKYTDSYLAAIENAPAGTDGRLYNSSASDDDRAGYFDVTTTAGSTTLSMSEGDCATFSAGLDSNSSAVQALSDAFLHGSIMTYPSFQQMLYYYMNLNSDADKVALFDSAVATAAQLFTDVYVSGNANPVNGATAGGITVSKELYDQCVTTESMSANNSYSVEITANELAHMKAYLADPSNNYYSLTSHNDATVSAEIWNAALYDRTDLQVTASSSTIADETSALNSAVEFLANNTEGTAVTNFIPGPERKNAGDENYAALFISVANGTAVVTDAEGNTYSNGAYVKKGTELTVSVDYDYGYVLDSVSVNGSALDDMTFTIEEDSVLTTTISKSVLILDKTELTMDENDTDTLTAIVRHTADTDMSGYGDLVFESSDPAVVEVDQEGNITALKAGIAKITVSARYGNGVFDRCYIIVENEETQADVVGKLMVVGRYSTSALINNQDFGHGFFQFTSYEDGLTIDVSNVMWLFQPTDAYYEAVNTYDGTGIDPVTWHNEDTDADEFFTQITDMNEIGNTFTVNKNEIFTMGNSTNFISSWDCALASILKGDILDILEKHGKYAAMNTLYESVLAGKLSFNSFKASLLACLAEIGYDIKTGFNPFNGTVEDSGTMINRELYRQAVDHDQYPNTTYEIEITRDQLAMLMMFMNDHSYYSVLDENCSGVIAQAWNVVTSGDPELKVDAGFNDSLSTPAKLKSEITRIAADKEGYEANHEIFKPEKTNFITYDTTQYVVMNGDQIVEPYEIVDPGTALTAYCLNSDGEIDTEKYVTLVNMYGDAISGNTVTMGALRADLTFETNKDEESDDEKPDEEKPDEEKPDEKQPDDEKPDDQKDNDEPAAGDTPSTGDAGNNLTVLFLEMIGSAVVITGITALNRKKEEE